MTTEQSEREETEVYFNLFALKKRLEVQQRRDISWNRIAIDAHIHVNTLTGMANNKSERVDRKTLTRLLRWFRDQGLDVTPGDLWTEGPVTKQ